MRVPLSKNSRRLLIGLTVAMLSTGLSGCAKEKSQQGYLVDTLLIDSIRPGVDNIASVEGTLGRPTFTSEFNSNEYYYVNRNMKRFAFGNPKLVDATVLRISFDAAGNVANVDKTTLDKIANVSPMKGKTPTLGRHRGLMEDIFGNIGTVGAGGVGGGNTGRTGGSGGGNTGGGSGGSGPNGS
jgi:outer membrane protein assembly factor BamE (lipoprotein component of BamABCDE complex)